MASVLSQPSTMLRKQKNLPPRVLATETPEQAAANKLAREQRDAQVRGVSSIHEMREAIKQASRALPV